MTGHITDGVGFILNLKEHGVEGQKMVIIGTVFIEDLDNKEKFAEVVSESNILVNATLAGMKPHEDVTLIKDKSMFRPDLVVADVVYNPAETRMVKEAKEAGCKLAIGGKGMLLWQGAAAYKLYTGLEMPTAEYQKFQEENENK